jgi:hypothetical protein
MKILLLLLLLSSTPCFAIEQCEQECGKDKYTNVDARLLCEQLCKLNLNLETVVDNEARMNLLANELLEQRKRIERVEYSNDVITERIK